MINNNMIKHMSEGDRFYGKTKKKIEQTKRTHDARSRGGEVGAIYTVGFD